MKKCHKCKVQLSYENTVKIGEQFLCDDCYIDSKLSKVHKSYYENKDSEFMQRLKVSFPIHPQKYH